MLSQEGLLGYIHDLGRLKQQVVFGMESDFLGLSAQALRGANSLLHTTHVSLTSTRVFLLQGKI